MEKKFISDWAEKLEKGELKAFPEKFVDFSNSGYKIIETPHKTLVLGPELFGSYEIIDSDGEICCQAGSIAEAKYILYASRIKPGKIILPADEKLIPDAVKTYEKHIDSLVKKIYEEYKKQFPKSNNHIEVTNQIFTTLNLRRF